MILDDSTAADLIDGILAIFPRSFITKLQQTKRKDEVASLIEKANVFDDFHFGKEGHYWKSLVHINASILPQPCCITMSVTIDKGCEVLLSTGYHGHIQDLYCYGATGCPDCDWHCHPMDAKVTELGEYLWKKVWHYLTPAAQLCPPTGCQLLLYCSSLVSAI